MTHIPTTPAHTTPGPAHLTDEQLTDLLFDQGSSTADHHLALCEPCRNELARLRASIDDFNHLSLAWAEDRAPRAIPVPSRAALRWQRTPVWSAVAAAGIAVIVLLGAHERQVQTSAATLASEASAQASIVANDNRLLMAIDDEIQLDQQTPSDLSAFAPGSQTRAADRLDTRTTTNLEN